MIKMEFVQLVLHMIDHKMMATPVDLMTAITIKSYSWMELANNVHHIPRQKRAQSSAQIHVRIIRK